MEVSIDQIVTSPTSLRLGCVVRYGKLGPVRFVVAVIEDQSLDVDTLEQLAAWATRQRNRLLDTTRAGEDLGEPLF